ncbi:MAG: NlpC/P60 family protein, partial [Fusobacteriaceae bacterium]
KKVRHVGVYIGENRFLHASTSKGVIISEISSYWRDNLWQVRKIL